MPIRRSPNGVRHTRPQPGRNRPEWVVAINRNEWSQSIVIGGRNQPVRPLSPAQWMALRFFARANSFSRTPSAFAEFQATTRGTATQAIKALEAGGYLVRQPFMTDGRSVSLRLTSKGKKALARDPFEVLVRAVDALDAKERTAMRRAMHQVLSTLATSGAHRRIGVCQDCTHFVREMRSNLPSTGPSVTECLLLGVPIQPEDVGLLCVHFQPMDEHRDGAHGE